MRFLLWALMGFMWITFIHEYQIKDELALILSDISILFIWLTLINFGIRERLDRILEIFHPDNMEIFSDNSDNQDYL